MQADYFRYCAIFALGGLYSDADLECIRRVAPLIDEARDGILFGRQRPLPAEVVAKYGFTYEVGPYIGVGNGFFAFQHPRHPLLSLAIELATANIENRVAEGPKGIWLTAGPGIFTSLYLLGQLRSIDAFIRYTAGSVLEPSVGVFCEVIDNPSEVISMLESVAIRPRQDVFGWIQPLLVRPAHRGQVSRWQIHTGDIYRDPF